MPEYPTLRPIESVIKRLADSGMSSSQIAPRVGKKPGTVDRIHQMIDYKSGLPTQAPSRANRLSAVERVITNLRDQGSTYGEIGNRLGRSGAQVRRIEQLIDYRP